MLSQWFSPETIFSPGDIGNVLETLFIIAAWCYWYLVGRYPARHRLAAPPDRIIPPKMSRVLRLRNPPVN